MAMNSALEAQAQMPATAQAQPEAQGQVPMRLSLLQNITTQSLLLTQLFSLLADPSASAASNGASQIAQLRSALQLTTSDLALLVQQAHEHQKAWKALQEKRAQVQSLERRVRSLVRVLEQGRGELEGLVREGRAVVGRFERNEQNPIPAPTLLAHAHALARHSSAPISSLLAPVDKAQYAPWPTEMHMRQGLLFQMQGSMSGIGDTGVVGKDAAPAQVVEQPAAEQQVHEEPGRRYDPNAVFQLELNSDDSDED